MPQRETDSNMGKVLTKNSQPKEPQGTLQAWAPLSSTAGMTTTLLATLLTPTPYCCISCTISSKHSNNSLDRIEGRELVALAKVQA